MHTRAVGLEDVKLTRMGDMNKNKKIESIGVTMHILMCNDDGILADGLRQLATYLSQYYRVTVVAPATEQSAKSHALTTEIP